MLKYVSKFTMDILPSVVATIIGAYIVNHYIATKPGPDAPVAAAVSPADPKKAEAKPSADLANLPEPGVKAKGISEKGLFEKTASERPSAVEKPVEKPADKPAETASLPTETRRHQPAPRTFAKSAATPVTPAVPVVAVPVVAAPNTAPPVEAAAAADERRDANDLARAAIERLRGESAPRPQEAARAPEAPRIVSASPVRPLPPPIMVSTPGAEPFEPPTGSSQIRPPYGSAARNDDPARPTPPADIPAATRPLDLRAEAAEPAPRREHTTVAEDVLSAAKSVFHAVLPK